MILHCEPDVRLTEIDEWALEFPVLRSAVGVRPWVPEYLDNWASGPGPSEDARHAARFVLWLWNDQRQWKSGPFDVMAAMQCWEKEDREAFLRWAKDPWWPTVPGVRRREVPSERRFWESQHRESLLP